ncbi:MAG: TolC family protein [Armatimonadetes bacterium]|nr:TolC family protein [Armatimonadota bacterium]
MPAGSEPARLGIPAPGSPSTPSRLKILSPILADPAPLPVPPRAAAEGRDTLELSLEDAARIALANSPRIDLALAHLRELREEAEVVAAPSRPRGLLLLSGEEVKTPEGPPISASFLGVTASFRSQASGNFERNTAFLALRQLLFDGGRVLAQIDEAKELARESEQEAVAEWHLLHLEVQQAYYDALQAQAEVETAVEALEVAQHSLRIAEARYRAGVVPRGDIVFAQLPLARAELDLTRTRQQVQSRFEELNRLLGLPQSTPLKLREPEAPIEIREALDDSIRMARDNRPDLRATQARISSAAKGILAAQRDNNPSLSFVSDIDRVGFDDKVLDGGGYVVGLKVEWPFLDGNLHAHLTRQAEARRDSAQAELRMKEEKIERELRQAYREVELAAQSYDTALVEVSQAREALRIAEGQYETGFSDFFPVRDSQRDLIVATVNRAMTRYDYFRARARLTWARGDRPLVDLEVEGPRKGGATP